jgi:hypothetical protein
MNVNRVISRALIAGIAASALGLVPAAVAQALPNTNGGGSQQCVYNGQFYPHGSAHPTMTDTFCDNGVWKTTLTGPEQPMPTRKGSVFAPKLPILTASLR